MFPKGAYFVLISPQSGRMVLDTLRWADSRGMTPSHIHVLHSSGKYRAGEWQNILQSHGVTGHSISSLHELPAVLGGDSVR